MKTRNTVLLLLVAGAVAGAVYYQSQKENVEHSSAAVNITALPEVTTGSIVRISVTSPDDSVALVKSNDKWYTDVERGYEADPAAVNGIINALDKKIEATVVSSNEASYADYHVTETSGTHVHVYEEGESKPVLDLLIGKDGSSAFSTYVRNPHEKEVLSVQAGLNMVFNRPDGWRDKQIFQFTGNNTTRIAATGTSSTFTVAKGADDQWVFESPTTGPAEMARITSLANTMSNLRANKAIEPAAEQTLADFGLEPARQTVQLFYADKSTSPSTETSVTLLIGKEANTEGEWYAKRADRNDVYTIGQYVAEALTPQPDTLKAAETEPVDIAPPPAPPAEEPVETPEPKPVAEPVAEEPAAEEAVKAEPAQEEPAAEQPETAPAETPTDAADDTTTATE